MVYAQSQTIHEEYFYHVYHHFRSFCVKDHVPQQRIFENNKNSKIYTALAFTTMQLPCFNRFREIFYVSNVKKVPDCIYELLTPIGLAY